MKRKEVESLVASAIDQANGMLPEASQLSADSGSNLFGEGGRLDSLGTVNSIVSIEYHISSVTGISIGLSDLLIDAKLGSIATYDLLCDFVEKQLEANSN